MNLPRSILEKPWDLEALRVHADELQQQGDPLGEFIALCLRSETAAPEREVRRRLEELAVQHEPRWSRGLPSSVTAAGTVQVSLRRGLPARLLIAGAPAPGVAEAIAAPLPISELRVEVAGHERAVPPESVWARVDSLSVHSTRLLAEYAHVATPQLRHLSIDLGHDGTQAPSLPTDCRLTSLSLLEGGLRRAALEALGSDRRLAGLTSLDVPVSSAGPWLVPALERWPLHTLGLALSRQSSGEPLTALANSQLRQTVSQLRLTEVADGSASNVAGVGALLSVQWPELRTLSLRLRVPISAQLVREAAALERVESLSFDLAPLLSETVEALAERPLPALRELRLSATRLTTAGLAKLLTAPWMKQLEVLDLDRNVLPANAGGLLASGQWPNLVELTLRQNAIGAEGVDQLLQGDFPRLTRLALDHVDHANERLFQRYPELSELQLSTLIGGSNEAVVALARAPHASRLRQLHLVAPLTSAALEALLTSTGLQHLVQLTVVDSSHAAMEQLRHHFGERLVVAPRSR